jgi:TonB family protein
VKYLSPFFIVASLLIPLTYVPLMSQKKTPVPSIPQVQTLVTPDIAAKHLDTSGEPEYPSKAIDKDLQGDVVLDVLIGKNGKVKNVQVVEGEKILAHAAVDAVRHWRYTPFTPEGKPVETRSTVKVKFVLIKGPILCPGQLADLYSFLPDSKIKGAVIDKESAAKNPSEQQVFHVGDRVKPPRVVYAPDPEYSETARREEQQGTDVLRVIVTSEGQVAKVEMARIIGYGLDQKAVNAVCNWKFTPASKDGKPVAVEINIEVSFRLY